MDTDHSTGITQITTSLMNVDSNVPKMNESRDRFAMAVDYFIHYIESGNNYKAVFLPIGVLDYDGDPEANITEMRSLWVSLVCLFGEPISGQSEFGYITMIPEARKYLEVLRSILNNPADFAVHPNPLKESMDRILAARQAFKQEGGLDGQKD